MCLGVPGRVTAIVGEGAARVATVAFEGARRSVCLAFLPEVRVGDWVVVHAGIAVAQVDEEAAAATLAAVAALDREEP